VNKHALHAVARLLVGQEPVGNVTDKLIAALKALPKSKRQAAFKQHLSTLPEVEASELRAAVLAVDPSDQPDASDAPLTWHPFPVETLPDPVRGFVCAGAKAIGCDVSNLVLPLLAVIGAAIGTTRKLRVKHGWDVLPIIWTVMVGESGSAKTPAFKLALKAVKLRQRKALEAHEELIADYNADKARYERELARWKRDPKAADDPPAEPTVPEAARCIVSDTTVEALAPLFKANPRGLLVARDELAGWIGSFDRYSGGKSGADASHWLSMHNGETIIVDRRTGNPRTIYVPEAAACLTGGIQPAILHRALGSIHRESGLAARLLLAYPPRTAKRWTEAEVDPKSEARIAEMIGRLYDLRKIIDQNGDAVAGVVKPTADAKAIWKAYYNHHNQEQTNLAGELSAAWSKLEEYAARLAMIVHYIRWAANDPKLESPDELDADSMTASVTMTEWFKREARRVYAVMSESPEEQNQRELVDLIRRRGGEITTRELTNAGRKYRTSGVAEELLKELVLAELGEWETVDTAGRPKNVFRLFGANAGNGRPLTAEENGPSASASSDDGIESEPDESSDDASEREVF
jgi:hypothetical protein